MSANAHNRLTFALLLAVGVFGVLAFVCASCSHLTPLRYERTVGTGTYYRTDAERIEATEFPKLSEP